MKKPALHVTVVAVHADAPDVQATHALLETYPRVQAVATVAEEQVDAPVGHAVQVVLPVAKGT